MNIETVVNVSRGYTGMVGCTIVGVAPVACYNGKSGMAFVFKVGSNYGGNGRHAGKYMTAFCFDGDKTLSTSGAGSMATDGHAKRALDRNTNYDPSLSSMAKRVRGTVRYLEIGEWSDCSVEI